MGEELEMAGQQLTCLGCGVPPNREELSCVCMCVCVYVCMCVCVCVLMKRKRVSVQQTYISATVYIYVQRSSSMRTTPSTTLACITTSEMRTPH